MASLGLTAVGWSVLAWRYPVVGLIGDPRFSLGAVEPLYRLIPDVFAFALLSLAYLWGYVCLRQTRRIGGGVLAGLALTLVVAAAANVALYPVGARDVYHYLMVLDIVVKHHGNPYLVLYAQVPADVFAPYGFLPDTPLGYGPGWLLLSLLPAPLAGFSSVLRTLLVYKVYNLLLILAAAGAIWACSGRGRVGLAAAYLYALNPLVLFEGVANGHNDVLVALFMVLAVVALRRRLVIALALLALATSIKFYTAPVAVVFAFYMLRQRWSARRLAVAALLVALTLAAVVVPFWSGGQMLAGLRDGGLVYMRDLYSSSILSLARQAAVESGAASVDAVELCAGLALVAMTGSALWAGRRAGDPAVVAAVVLGWALLLATNLFPWYLVTLVAAIAAAGDEGSLAYLFPATLLGGLYYFVSITCWSLIPTRSLLIHVMEACTITVPLLVFAVWRTIALAKEREAGAPSV